MKVIVCGGRDFTDYGGMERHLDFYLQNMDKKTLEICEGECEGADSLAKEYAELKGYKVKEFPADWAKYGNAAGPIRNTEMAAYAELCIAFWDGKSKGTRDMLKKAKKFGLKTRIVKY